MVDAGEGMGRDGVNRWTAILEQFCAAQEILRKRRPRKLLTAGGEAVTVAACRTGATGSRTTKVAP